MFLYLSIVEIMYVRRTEFNRETKPVLNEYLYIFCAQYAWEIGCGFSQCIYTSILRRDIKY